jgi:hypothetical protein
LSIQLGQPFVIENKGGASTTIGAADVFKSPADGYTLMVVTPTFAVAQSVYPNLPFGPKDFTPVAPPHHDAAASRRQSQHGIQDGRRLHQVCQGEPRASSPSRRRARAARRTWASSS